MAKYTTAAEFEDAYSTLFSTFKTGKTKSIAWRKWQLKQCWWMVTENEAEIVRALNDDLSRHDIESHMTELRAIKPDILECVKNVEKWAADTIPDAGFLFGSSMFGRYSYSTRLEWCADLGCKQEH
jgi:aldehyde dehydrogenase (NAD+)